MNPYLLINLKQKQHLEAPSGHFEVRVLMDRLSHSSKIICGLEAVKMVSYIWEELADKNRVLTTKQKEVPKKTIETIENWLNGKATMDEIKNIKSNIALPANSAAYYVGKSVIDLMAYIITDFPIYFTIVHAQDAASAYEDYFSHIQFYSKWWSRCFPLIQKELQDKYDTLCKQINGDI